MNTCKDCTSEEVVNNGRCRPHYNAYMREYKRARYDRLRAEWIDKLGGVCVDCGSTDSLEFDHDIASEKTFDVSEFHSYSLKVIAEEMQKCVLRCSDHHLEKSLREGDFGSVDHGEGLSGKKNCTCLACRAKKAEYMKTYHATHVRKRDRLPS